MSHDDVKLTEWSSEFSRMAKYAPLCELDTNIHLMVAVLSNLLPGNDIARYYTSRVITTH